MDVDEALERYGKEKQRFRRAALAVKDCLEVIASEADLHVVVVAREKDIASYRAKVVHRAYADAWAEVTDKAGARVIVPAPGDVDAFVSLLSDLDDLEVLRVEDKRDVVHPETLAYSGVHVQLVAPREPDDTDRVECEVQVRTAAQDAWSVVSHMLLYKPVLELPKEDQHAVYRLVALMELFDQEVERVTARLPRLPGYEFRHVLRAAEAEFLGLAHAQSYRRLSVDVLSALGEAVPNDEDYPRRLHDWVDANRDLVRDAVKTYGPRSGLAESFRYSLFSQAELLIVLERLATAPLAFEAAWKKAGLPVEWLKAVATYSEAQVE